jgi:hypothetical protein
MLLRMVMLIVGGSLSVVHVTAVALLFNDFDVRAGLSSNWDCFSSSLYGCHLGETYVMLLHGFSSSRAWFC